VGGIPRHYSVLLDHCEEIRRNASIVCHAASVGEFVLVMVAAIVSYEENEFHLQLPLSWIQAPD
jgi:hypothetical protein